MENLKDFYGKPVPYSIMGSAFDYRVWKSYRRAENDMSTGITKYSTNQISPKIAAQEADWLKHYYNGN